MILFPVIIILYPGVREVARVYSERLGYTVNESTVRGIKKRYLEGIQKGKIESPGLSPRSGKYSSLIG